MENGHSLNVRESFKFVSLVEVLAALNTTAPPTMTSDWLIPGWRAGSTVLQQLEDKCEAGRGCAEGDEDLPGPVGPDLWLHLGQDTHSGKICQVLCKYDGGSEPRGKDCGLVYEDHLSIISIGQFR